MTPREKNLLILLCGTLFLVLNVVGYKKLYAPKITAANARVSTLEREYARAEGNLRQSDRW
ncbi:MAG TPA: hypothetical protein DDW68_03705, partial [Verrucomicrobiales bacterium]|nr:hypothetical protein [Verrucomicrobiales bacterium]